MNSSLGDIVKKSLLNYDQINNKYNDYIMIENTKIDVDTQNIIFNNKDKFKYEILGIFDSSTQIWMWGWMTPEFKYRDTMLSKKLLDYGLKIEPFSYLKNNDRKILDDMMYLKTQLVNSRFIVNDMIQLELHLAIALYLVKDNVKFIYPRIKFIDKEKNKYITVYYFILN